MSGILWAIAAGLGFGVFQTLNRKAGEDLDPIRGTFILLAVSSLLLIVAAVLTTDVTLLWTSPPSAILYFVAAGFIHFFIGWTLISISQSHIGAARTGAVIGTMPLFGLVIDLTLYREVFSWQTLLGLLLIVVGIYVISFR